MIVKGSIKTARPSWMVTAAISPREAALIPSRKEPANHDLRMAGKNRLNRATRIKDGRKIPKAASKAEGQPPNR